MPMNGECLCGAVAYEIDADAPGPLVYCHCAQCRKAQGGLFAANVPVPRAAFRLVRGHEFIKQYRATAAKARFFCGRCGSGIYSQLDGAKTVRIRAGTLNNDTICEPSAHIYVPSRSALTTITDGLPEYPEKEPGR